MRRTIKKIHLLATLVALVMLSPLLLAPQRVEAAPPRLFIPSGSGNSVSFTLRIESEKGARIEMPNGAILNSYSGTYTTYSNGVYAFTAYLGEEQTTITFHVTNINRSAASFRTRSRVPLTLKFTDLISGVKDYRLRNGPSHTWGAWTPVPEQKNNAEFKLPNWTIQPNTPNGDLKIYAQFRDKAGNITDRASETGSLMANKIPYVLVDFDNRGPTFDFPQQKYYVGPAQNNTVPIKIPAVKDANSDQSNFRIQVDLDGAGYASFPMSNLKNGVFNYVLPNKKDGERTIRIRILDDLGNISVTKSFKIFYDMTKASATTLQVLNHDGTTLIPVKHDGENMGLVTFNGTDNKVKVHAVLQDKFADKTDGSGFLTGQDGIAKVKITEFTRNNSGVDEWIETPDQPSVSRTFQGTELQGILQSNGGRFDWQLSPGLIKFFEIEMTDNAGNVHKQVTPPFIANGLVIEDFAIDVVNPKQLPGEDIPDDKNLVLANANVTVNVTYNFLNDVGFDSTILKGVKGQLVAKIEPATALPIDTGYEKMAKKIVTDDVTGKDKTVMQQTFTVPADALKGATIKVRGYIRAEFTGGGELYAYFPDREQTVYHQIGTVDGNIDEEIRFQLVR